ncbi:MAG: DUF6688 family protein [Aureliella sp.]
MPALIISLSDRWRRPISTRCRIVLWLYGAMMPLICFAFTTRGAGPFHEWQSGNFSAYAAQLLRPSAWLPFTLWLSFSIVALSCWAFQPSSARHWWVRLGLYSGVILALQYWVIVVSCTSVVTLIMSAFVLPVVFTVSILLEALAKNCKRFQIWHLLCLTSLAAVGAAVFRFLPENLIEPALFMCLVALAAAPTLCLIAYVRAAWAVSTSTRSQLDKPYRFIGAFVCWLLGWLISWRFAVQAMFDEYSRLPVNPPNCYFANAAAHAHQWLGGRRGLPERRQFLAENAQVVFAEATLTMKRLKFLELALLATAPRVHRFIRRYYDRWGKPAARYCSRHVWFADLTCVGLKPVEALAEIVRIAAGVPYERMAAIYELTSAPPR